MTVLTLWVFLPFGFKRLSCLLLRVLDALAEDDDGVPKARAPLRLCVPESVSGRCGVPGGFLCSPSVFLVRGYLQATIKECCKALVIYNTGLHARTRVDEARRFMGETVCIRKVLRGGCVLLQRIVCSRRVHQVA